MEKSDTRVVTTPLPSELRGALDLAPLPDPGAWLALLPDPSASPGPGTTSLVAAWRGDEVRTLARVALPEEPGDDEFAGRRRRLRLRACADGRFAAVGADHGRFGAALDLLDGRTTLSWDQGSYFPETVPFTAAFAVHAGRTVLIHRTDWNRLDVSDPSTGELLTPRAVPEHDEGDESHYLDYFRGDVVVSPDHLWIVDNGWHWHPFGMPVAWSLSAWLSDNVWESEDGPTWRILPDCDDWLTPICWLDDRHVAIGGADVEERDRVRVVDVESGDESRSFAGPRGDHFFADGHRLFASGDEGLEVWDVRSGEVVDAVPGFSPTHHHPSARLLARLDGDRLLTMGIAQD